MSGLNVFFDNANRGAAFGIFLVLIALAFRGAHRHRRWSLALIGASIATWTGLLTSQWIEMYFGNWDARIRDPQQAQEIAETSTRIGAMCGFLLCVGLALEIAAMLRKLRAAESQSPSSNSPPDATGAR
jgi:hypothetical protein